MTAVASATGDVRAARRLALFTVAWNLTEAFVALLSGILAGSIALVGFGADSIVESLSGAVMLWRFGATDHDGRREKLALRLVGATLLILAVYVAGDAAQSLARREPPEKSIPGIILAMLSLAVMPLLARAKRRVAGRLQSASLHADSRQTDICAVLSAILLVGLALNAIAGWWWADPMAAIAMTPLIAREGVNAVRGEACGCAVQHPTAKSD